MNPPKLANDPRIIKALEIMGVSSKPAADVARSVNLSTSWFEHLFKAQVGLSLRQHMMGQRLQKAARLLEEREMPVKELSYCVGYHQPSSFVRAFRKQFGETPQIYRRRTRQLKMLTKSG